MTWPAFCSRDLMNVDHSLVLKERSVNLVVLRASLFNSFHLARAVDSELDCAHTVVPCVKSWAFVKMQVPGCHRSIVSWFLLCCFIACKPLMSGWWTCRRVFQNSCYFAATKQQSNVMHRRIEQMRRSKLMLEDCWWHLVPFVYAACVPACLAFSLPCYGALTWPFFLCHISCGLAFFFLRDPPSHRSWRGPVQMKV